MVDNTTTESTMGTSHSPKPNKLIKDIWIECTEKDIWLTMARILGCDNIEADRESSTCRRCTEWCLKKKYFHKCLRQAQCYSKPICLQITSYVSYRANPAAFAINSFKISWQNHLFYAFLPFILITIVLQKIQEKKTAGLLLLPK